MVEHSEGGRAWLSSDAGCYLDNLARLDASRKEWDHIERGRHDTRTKCTGLTQMATRTHLDTQSQWMLINKTKRK